MVNRALTLWAHKGVNGVHTLIPKGRRPAVMLLADIARMLAGLAVTLGLIGLCVVALRRYGPETLKRLQGLQSGRERRLSIVETLVLDPSRRLVLVRFDTEERLLLLGEGRMIDAKSAPQPVPPAPEET